VTAKPPPIVDLEIATATGRSGSAYVARLRAEGSHGHSKMKLLEGVVEGTERDALAQGAEVALDALAGGDLERAASRHQVDIRHVPAANPHGAVEPLVARARELAVN
jgi:hypothetical protein